MTSTATGAAEGRAAPLPVGTRRGVALALVTIVNIASIYLAQPLLPFIGDSLGAGATPMSIVQAAIQIAFGAGLVVFGILADTTERRRLLMVMGLGLALSAGLAAVSDAYWVFLVASLGIGASAAILPVAIATAAAARDVRALGWILSAAPAGIVIGRLAAGALGEVTWRLAFVASAAAAVCAVVLIRSVLPADRPEVIAVSFRRGFREMAALTRRRRNMLVNTSNAAVFFGWSAVWTMLAFQLEGPPFDLSELAVGVVGLAGIGGAVSGQVGARMNARLGERGAARVALAVAAVGAVALTLSGDVLTALIVALFVHNAAAWVLQAVNVPSAARRAGPDRAARGAALLYLGNFVATAAGAIVGALVWDGGGWPAVGALAFGTVVIALALDVAGRGFRGPLPPEA